MKICILLGLIFCFTGAPSHAQIKTWSLKESKRLELTSKKGVLTPKLIPPSVDDLHRLKIFEANGEYAKCFDSLDSLIKRHSIIKDWIYSQGASCALKWLAFDAPKARPKVQKLIGQYEKAMGWKPLPSDSLIKKRYREMQMALLTYDISTKRQDWALINKISEIKSWLSKEEKSILFRAIGEIFFKQQKLDVSRDYFQKSLSEFSSDETRSRLMTVEAALNIKVNPEISSKDTSGAKEDVVYSKTENDLYNRIQTALKAGDYVGATEDGATLMSQFSSGTRAKWVSDKLIETLLNVIDRDSEPLNSIKKKMLSNMAKVDGTRVLTWAQSLMRQSNYLEAQVLAEAALSKNLSTGLESKNLDILAYTHFFTGEFKEAKRLYMLVAENHVGSGEYLNSLFMLGMIEVRSGEWAGAMRFFERILSQDHPTNLDVKVRYWLWRSLEKVDPTRAIAEANILQTKYPLSYYGLRALAGTTSQIQLSQITGAPGVPNAAKNFESLPTWGADTKTLERFILLSDAGWFAESQEELATVDFINLAKGMVPLAQLWSRAGQYSKSINLLNRVWDIDPTLMSIALVKLAYPKPYMDLVETQAKIRKLEPNLVLSLMRQESAFSPAAVSSSNALGLMQMIPKTAQETAKELGVKITLPDSLMDPEINIQFCTFYLAKMAAQFDGNIPWALAAYNAGPTRIKKWLKIRGWTLKPSSDPLDEAWVDELPWDETQFYVKAILRNLILNRMLDSGLTKFGNPIWTP